MAVYRGKDLTQLGTSAWPLRPSSIDQMMRCPRKWLEAVTEEGQGTETKKAADTGSMVHAGVVEWDRSQDLARAHAVMAAAVDRYPDGDLDDAIRTFHHYTTDPRFATPPIYAEAAVTLYSPQGVITGTCDQIRRESDGLYYVWDIKTGKEPPDYYLHRHLYQVVAYTMAARQTLSIDARPGGLLCLYQYRRRGVDLPSPRSVIQPMDLTLSQCETLMTRVWKRLADIREQGPAIEPRHGEDCGWCPLRGWRCV